MPSYIVYISLWLKSNKQKICIQICLDKDKQRNLKYLLAAINIDLIPEPKTQLVQFSLRLIEWHITKQCKSVTGREVENICYL